MKLHELVERSKVDLEQTANYRIVGELGDPKRMTVSLESYRKLLSDIVNVEEEVKKPLTLIYLANVVNEETLERMRAYYEAVFGGKCVVLPAYVRNVVQIDPESNIATMFVNADNRATTHTKL